jgi:hypothetical protein
MPAADAVTSVVPGAAGLVNVASTAPLDPLVDVETVSEPLVVLQSTGIPDTGLPCRSVTRTVSSAFAPATTAIESAVTFTSADAGPATPVASSVAVLVPTIACSVFTLVLSLTVHTVVAIPEESVPVSVSDTIPLPAVGFQLTGTPNTGCPASVTTTLTLAELPAITVRSAFAESTATLKVFPVVPVLSGPDAEVASLEHAAAPTLNDAANARMMDRMPNRHGPIMQP